MLLGPSDPPGLAPQREMLSLATARVADACLRQPVYVDGALDLVSVCRALAAAGATQALVRDRHNGGDRLGIFTTTDLRDALLRDTPPAALAVREVAHFDIVAVAPEAELFEALWLMVRHRVHRLLVRDAASGVVHGVLGQLELVGFVANHSHLIALQIDEARSLAALAAASVRIDTMVATLHADGIKIERIARLVGELNRRVVARAWSLVAPPELVSNSCLLLMGSEGRGEQILKTDQDNALLLRDGFSFDGLEAVAVAMNAALQGLGYPPCPGNIMLSNPLWRQPLAAFRDTLQGWVLGAEADGPMHLAIFVDAAPVAGDGGLLREARAHLDRVLTQHDAFLARFASAADQFDEPSRWWQRLTRSADELPLDLKKLGTFPIVHGVRALALQYGVAALGTADRLRSLADAHHLDATLARDLGDALHFLMALKLTHQLRQRERGEAAGNEVRPSALGTLEREPLQDALAIVRRFRAFLRQHFRLDAL